MSASGIIVGAVGVLVRPIAKGLDKSMAKSFSGAPKVAETVGRSMGRSMNRAFSASKPIDVQRATKNLKDAQDAVAAHAERSSLRQRKAQQAVSAARKDAVAVAASSSERVRAAQSKVESAEEDLARVVQQTTRDREAAARKVELAESDLARVVEQSGRDQEAAKRRVDAAQQNYNATIEKFGAESAEAQSAANRLADAEDKLAKTVSDGAGRQEHAKQRVADAQDRLARVTEEGAHKQERAQARVTDAQEEYSRAVEQSGKDSEAAKKAADDLAIAEENLKTAAIEAAQGHEALQAEVSEAKRALDEAERSSGRLARAWSGAKDFGADYKGMGDRLNKAIGPKVWQGIKWGVLGAAGAISGVLLVSLKKGWDRLTSIENAEAKLAGLGHSAETVETVMDNALTSVKGTAFGLGDAASAAAAAVAAGVKPGQELESYLGLVGDAATIAGTGIEEMGAIFGKVMSSDKVQGDIFNQLENAGISIVPMLSDALGVSAEEVRKLGAAGEISSEDFLKAMSSMEGAALKGGDTAQGSIANLGAAMGRFGASLLKSVFPMVQPLMERLTGMFDYLSDKAGPVIEDLTERFKEWVSSPQVQAFLGTVRDIAVELHEKALKPLGEWIGRNWQPIATAVGGLVAYLGGSMLIAAIGTIGSALGAVFGSATVIGGAIATVVGALVGFFTQTETGQEMLGRFVSFVKDTLWPGVVGAFEAIRDFVVDELWPMFKSRFEAIRDLVVEVFTNVIQPAFEQFSSFLLETVWPIVKRVFEDYIGPAIAGAWEYVIKPAMAALDDFIGKVLGPTITWLWEHIVSPVFSAIGDFIGWSWENVIFPALDALKYFVLEVLPPAFVWLSTTVKNVWDGIQRVIGAVVSWFKTWVLPVIQVVIKLSQLAFEALRSTVKTVWEFIKNRVIAPVVTWFRNTAWPMISSVIDSIKRGFNVMRDSLKTAWDFVKDRVIAPVATWFRDTIGPLFDKVTGGIGDAFETMKQVIKTSWEAVKTTAKAPIKFVVETVVNKALVGNFNKLAEKLGVTKLPSVSLPAGFDRGGILPGQSSYRDGDDQVVTMRRGEGVYVSEALRDPVERARLYAANRWAMAGRSMESFRESFPGFSGGGILDRAWQGVKGVGSRAKELAGDALEKVLNGIDFVAEALADPKSIFSKLYDSVIGKIPAAGLVTDAAKASGRKVLDGVVDKVLGNIGFGGGEDGAPPPPGARKGGGSLGLAGSIASSMGLRMTSGYRRGSRTAGTGSVSYHALNRARDYAGPAASMMRFFNAMHPYRPTELLYSPAGARQWRRWGAQANTSGVTRRMHHNHVHVAFNRGGVLGDHHRQRPLLFDQGGVLPPGLHGVLNATRKPEAVLTAEQLDQLRRLTSGGAPAAGDTFVVNAETDKAKELVSALMWAQRTQRRRRGRYAHAGR